MLGKSQANFELPELPGQLVIYKGDKFYEYIADTGFTPVSGFKDEADFLTYDPSVSPDGKWRVDFDESLKRFVVSDGEETLTFEHWSFSLSQITWSPDSQYIAYRADDDQAEWTGRIMVMSIKNSETIWIGHGESPRWYE